MVRAIYDSIYKDLLDRIEEGEYGYQSYIPSEGTLVKQYGCSHNTLRKAIALLAQRGYLQPVHGKGVRVIWQPKERTAFEMGGIETFKETAARNRLHAVTRVETLESVIADEYLAARTGFAVGDELIHVDRVRELDGQAKILDRNWFLAKLLPGLTRTIAEQSIFEYIEDTLGMRIATSKRTITAERATKDDRRLLDLGDFEFVVVVTNHTFNGEGVMFEYTQSHHCPDGFSFSAVARREGWARATRSLSD